MCPALETPLLSPQIGRGWLGGLGLEIFMHAFVRAIVLWMTRTGKLNGDSLLNPPHAQPGEPSQPTRGKRTTMIDPNDGGKPVNTGHTLKSMPRCAELLIGHRSAANHKMAVQILHRQWIATPAVRQFKPALEVHRPHVIGILRRGEFSGLGGIGSRSPPAGLDHAVALQDRSDCTARRRLLDCMLLQKQISKLLRPPGRMPATVLQDELFNHRIGQLGIAVWTSGFSLATRRLHAPRIAAGTYDRSCG